MSTKQTHRATWAKTYVPFQLSLLPSDAEWLERRRNHTRATPTRIIGIRQQEQEAPAALSRKVEQKPRYLEIEDELDIPEALKPGHRPSGGTIKAKFGRRMAYAVLKKHAPEVATRFQNFDGTFDDKAKAADIADAAALMLNKIADDQQQQSRQKKSETHPYVLPRVAKPVHGKRKRREDDEENFGHIGVNTRQRNEPSKMQPEDSNRAKRQRMDSDINRDNPQPERS